MFQPFIKKMKDAGAIQIWSTAQYVTLIGTPDQRDLITTQTNTIERQNELIARQTEMLARISSLITNQNGENSLRPLELMILLGR